MMQLAVNAPVSMPSCKATGTDCLCMVRRIDGVGRTAASPSRACR